MYIPKVEEKIPVGNIQKYREYADNALFYAVYYYADSGFSELLLYGHIEGF